ncbi:MAG: type IV pilus assembly protein PilB [Lentimonas sp.]|jgi:type IV pilus assembly protein PilB
MFEDHNDTIYEIIKSTELISTAELDEIIASQVETGKSLAEVLVDTGIVERTALLSIIAEYLGYAFKETLPDSIPGEIASAISSETALTYAIVPVELSETSISLFAKDPFNSSVVDVLTFSLNKDVKIIVCDPDQVDKLIISTYGEEKSSIDDLLGDLADDLFDNNKNLFDGDEAMSDSDLTDIANQTPIIRFVNLVLQQAIKDQASDIHFEPFEDQFRIRYRIDGALYEMAPPPKSLAIPVTSRIKVLSNLNISESRIPQDGRIKMTISGRPVDLRVSTLPTRFGESVVLRVLDKSVVNLNLESLGLNDDIIETIRDLVDRPNGIFIVTGPTGSGKTTTLYSALREVNVVDTKILTAEDPVEYEIEGIMQVSINHQVGLNFSRVLRAFLRQDPDKIMIGEIRDLETAQIAVQAALTGHVVLSTLHTNDAPGAVTRLIDMGLEPFLLSASIEAILAQRLVRRICKSCRTAYEPEHDLIELLGVEPLEIADKDFFYGEGCAHCNETGYRGRIGLFEMMVVSDTIRDLINNRAPTLVIKQKALEQGMRSLRSSGLRTIFDGNSTVEEVLKYT